MSAPSPVEPSTPQPLEPSERSALTVVRLFGTVGALLLGFGSLGAGAAPTINPVHAVPVLRVFARIPTVSLAIAFAGMGMLVIGWLMLGRFARPRRLRLVSRADLTRTLIMWAAPLVLIPPLFSRDVYSYLAQSELVHRGMDPFAIGPAQGLGVDDPITSGVANLWRDTPAPYGPLFLRIGGWFSAIIGNHIVTGVLLHRALALIGVALIVWTLPRLARRFGVQPVTALWLGATNPLVIFHLVGGAHNDALAIGLMMLGLELGIRRLPVRVSGDTPPPLASGELLFILLGTVVITLGVTIKVNAILALPFLAVMVARRWSGTLKDLARAATPMFVVFAVVLVTTCLATGLGFGWVDTLDTPALVRSWIAPLTELANIGGVFGIALGFGNHTNALVSVLTAVGYVVAAVITSKFLWDSFRWRYRPMIGLGVSLGTVLLLHVALQPWYMLWAVIPLAASAGTSRFRMVATAVSVILTLLVPPPGTPFDGRSYVVPQAYVAAGVVLIIALLVVRRVAPLLLARPEQIPANRV